METNDTLYQRYTEQGAHHVRLAAAFDRMVQDSKGNKGFGLHGQRCDAAVARHDHLAASNACSAVAHLLTLPASPATAQKLQSAIREAEKAEKVAERHIAPEYWSPPTGSDRQWRSPEVRPAPPPSLPGERLRDAPVSVPAAPEPAAPPPRGEYLALDECVDGELYEVVARNFRVGRFRVATQAFVGLREKFGEFTLDTEEHYALGLTHGTVKPLRRIEPPTVESVLHGLTCLSAARRTLTLRSIPADMLREGHTSGYITEAQVAYEALILTLLRRLTLAD